MLNTAGDRRLSRALTMHSQLLNWLLPLLITRNNVLEWAVLTWGNVGLCANNGLRSRVEVGVLQCTRPTVKAQHALAHRKRSVTSQERICNRQLGACAHGYLRVPKVADLHKRRVLARQQHILQLQVSVAHALRCRYTAFSIV
jgi:hypothetical protein